jgi:ATP-dependent helicase/nuclease subunit A
VSAGATPIDQQARDEVRDALSLTMFVEAGAGTGKTTALVSRVVALVTSGVALRNIAAITFTEAAAAELRDRIRLALERGVAGVGDPALDDAGRDRCEEALHELDDAALTTLHGFAQRILAQHPLEAGLPPRFEVVDDIAAQIAFDQRWGDFLDALFEDPDLADVLLTALTLGVRLDGLRRVARAMHDYLDRLPEVPLPVAPLPDVDVAPVLDAVQAAIGLAEQCRDDDDKLLPHLDAVGAVASELAAAVDDLDRLDVLARAPKLTSRLGSKTNWACDVDEVRGCLQQAQAARDELLGRCRTAVLGALVERIRRMVLETADTRRREGRLEFHDLLVLARDVLASSTPVRTGLAHRFEALLIDEFQDTDPLQIEIAVLLAAVESDAGVTGGGTGWSDAELHPGRLFVVGDPKQSIYRFRRADLALYHEVEAALHTGHRRFEQNFRSVPAVLAWVNHVFAGLLPDDQPGIQAQHVRLHAFRDAVPGAQAAVQVFGAPTDDGRIGDIRVRESAEVAALVRRAKADGWPIVDPVTGAVRGARYSDIALLLPTRTALPELERALEAADIPVRIESQSLVYSTAEVRDLLVILTAIDDPTDEVAVVASLRAPAFGCSDRDLVEFKLAGGRWDYRREQPSGLAADHRVASGLAALRDLHDRRWWATVGETVSTVVRERRMLELAAAHPRPRDHWRRIRFLLDRARAYDDAGGNGLRGFVEWVQQQSDERARAVEVVVPEPDDDALRILTVHGAKGLEFPVVVLAGLNAAPQNRPSPVLWTSAGSLEVAIGPRDARTATLGYNDQEEIERRLDDAERIRLLYVAATRARDHLLISLHHKAGDRRSPAAKLWKHAEGAPSEWITIDVPSAATTPVHPDKGAPTRSDEDALAHDLETRADWVENRSAHLVRAGRPATVAATSLASGLSAAAPVDPGLAKGPPDDDAPAWRRGRAGTSIGRAVHATLQTIDLATGDGLEATAGAQAWAEEIPGREREVQALVRSVLDAPVVRDAVAGGRYWREVPVAATVDDVTVEGFVDLLVETPDGLVVVDYKTDRAPGDDELDALMAKYRTQGAAYALALERVLDRRVTRCVFVFAREGGRAIEREVTDVSAAIGEVEALLEARLAGAP